MYEFLRQSLRAVVEEPNTGIKVSKYYLLRQLKLACPLPLPLSLSTSISYHLATHELREKQQRVEAITVTRSLVAFTVTKQGVAHIYYTYRVPED